MNDTIRKLLLQHPEILDELEKRTQEHWAVVLKSEGMVELEATQEDASKHIRRWMSRRHTVQFEPMQKPMTGTLTIGPTSIRQLVRGENNITFDDVMRIKRECGFGECPAIELFPTSSEYEPSGQRTVLLLPEGADVKGAVMIGERFKPTERKETLQ